MTKSLQEAQKNYDKICEDNARRRNEIRAKIDKCIKQNISHDDLKNELSQAWVIAENSEKIAKRNLDAAVETDKKHQADKMAKMQARSAEADQKYKARALNQYVEQGGKPEEFEKAWPALREKLIETAVVQGAAGEEKRGPIIRGL